MTPQKSPHHLLNLLGNGDWKDKNRGPIDLHGREDRKDKLESTGKRKGLVSPIIQPSFDLINKALTISMVQASGNEGNPKIADRKGSIRKLDDGVDGTLSELANTAIKGFAFGRARVKARHRRELI